MFTPSVGGGFFFSFSFSKRKLVLMVFGFCMLICYIDSDSDQFRGFFMDVFLCLVSVPWAA